jgi:hypothetical protein
MLVFGGYTSIQGIRVPLAFVCKYWNISIETADIPSWPWWIIPLLNNFIQIFVKWIPGLKPFWRPSIVFDALTTAIFLSFGLLAAFLQLDAVFITGIILAGMASAALGIILTVASEKLFLGSFPIMGAMFKPYS